MIFNNFLPTDNLIVSVLFPYNYSALKKNNITDLFSLSQMIVNGLKLKYFRWNFWLHQFKFRFINEIYNLSDSFSTADFFETIQDTHG